MYFKTCYDLVLVARPFYYCGIRAKHQLISFQLLSREQLEVFSCCLKMLYFLTKKRINLRLIELIYGHFFLYDNMMPVFFSFNSSAFNLIYSLESDSLLGEFEDQGSGHRSKASWAPFNKAETLCFLRGVSRSN